MKDLFDYYDEMIADKIVPVLPTEPSQNETSTEPSQNETPTDIVNSILARLDDLERMVTNARNNQSSCE